ncbi:hypothetical protein [Ferrimonas gelatinilytica]|uniref:DUF2846 domain-containing protein n=1 Tax=Ferrimonas gelatinilytica TaxID=1255257 RepID=A0ABP9S548_9GAMM
MKNTLYSLLALTLLGGCAAGGADKRIDCGEVAVFQQPEGRNNLYKVAVTRIDDKDVVSKASYRLLPGSYRLRLTEFIDDPRLAVPNAKRSYREMTLEVVAGQRYHLVAELAPEHREEAERYWQPKVWKQVQSDCSMPANPR